MTVRFIVCPWSFTGEMGRSDVSRQSSGLVQAGGGTGVSAAQGTDGHTMPVREALDQRRLSEWMATHIEDYRGAFVRRAGMCCDAARRGGY
jgi:hypothetical protein